jgi:hypothetical protein
MVESIVQLEHVMVWNVKFVIIVIPEERSPLKLQKLNYLFFLANINDFTQSNVKIKPVIIIISLELSAHTFSNGFPRLLKKSSTPKKVIKPKVTTMCISNFFLLGINKVKIAKSNIGKPNIEGIYEVIELLALK